LNEVKTWREFSSEGFYFVLLAGPVRLAEIQEIMNSRAFEPRGAPDELAQAMNSDFMDVANSYETAGICLK
jgi:hypothetical protein